MPDRPQNPQLGSHAHTREVIEATGDMLVRSTNAPEEIRRHIGELESTVQQHFAGALDDSIYERIAFESPWLTPQSESLRQQRTSMLDLIGQLRELSITGDGSDAWRQEIREKFERFVELFFEHDAGLHSLRESQHDAWAVQ